MRELFHTEEREGFTVRFYAHEEDMDPRDSFDEAIEAKFDIFGKIDRGELLWFMVEAEASKNGIALGHDWLGGCCYESFEAFLEVGYAADLADQAIEEAKQTLAKLNG